MRDSVILREPDGRVVPPPLSDFHCTPVSHGTEDVTSDEVASGKKGKALGARVISDSSGMDSVSASLRFALSLTYSDLETFGV